MICLWLSVVARFAYATTSCWNKIETFEKINRKQFSGLNRQARDDVVKWTNWQGSREENLMVVRGWRNQTSTKALENLRAFSLRRRKTSLTELNFSFQFSPDFSELREEKFYTFELSLKINNVECVNITNRFVSRGNAKSTIVIYIQTCTGYSM